MQLMMTQLDGSNQDWNWAYKFTSRNSFGADIYAWLYIL